jgi:hypothetical protein
MIRSGPRPPQRLSLHKVGSVVLLILFSVVALASPCGAGGSPQAPKVVLRQVATYPRDGDPRVPADAEVYFVFDQPTLKSGSFSVCDLDTTVGNQCVSLTERWSALGDTVFLKPLLPMAFGHRFGMRVGTVQASDGTFTTDLPIIQFRIIARADLRRLQGGAGERTETLAPGVPLPLGFVIQEAAGTSAEFNTVRIEFFSDFSTPPGLPPYSVAPFYSETQAASIRVERLGVVSATVPVTVPTALAREIPGGRFGLLLTFEGTDETGLPVAVAGFSSVILTPELGAGLSIGSAVLEWPLHGSFIAAGDTLRPRAVVTGVGTGPFRAAFYVDGELVAIEEGQMEAGQPVTVEMRGPLPTRRLGEHRLTFSVESPQEVDARPISFICAPPAHDIEQPRRRTLEPVPPPRPMTRFALRTTWIGDGATKFRSQRGSATGWASWRASYELSPTRSLEAVTSLRVRVDSTANGSASPQEIRIRYVSPHAEIQWGDAAPALATGAPLLASPVPRRGAQARWAGSPLGELQAYATLATHPASAGGPASELDSDLYAAKLERAFARDAVRATIYGGYTHEEPTAGGLETRVRARAIYGASGRVRLSRGWSLLGDAATVRHRTIPGVETGRSRTAWRTELAGDVAKIAAKAQAFAYAPDLATALNPYAVSDRRGGQVDLSRRIWNWSMLASYRTEQPMQGVGLVPNVRVDRLSVGGRLALNQSAAVTPMLIRVTHRGANTRFTENHVATELDLAEPFGGRTRGRFDIAILEDERGLNTRRRVVSGSLVSTRRHPGRVTSTLTLGMEADRQSDFALTNRTTQGSLEVRWEAIPGRLLVTPFFTAQSRDYALNASHANRVSGRIQVAFLRVPRLGENVVALEGRVERIERIEPLESKDTEGAALLTIGQRFDLGTPR